jgi:hypothetical protein
MRRLQGALIGVLLALAACGAPPANQPQPEVTSDISPTVESTASPSAADTTPSEVPEGQQFQLGDVAEYDDGLLIEIAGAVADKAAKTDRGAEATNGEIVSPRSGSRTTAKSPTTPRAC